MSTLNDGTTSLAGLFGNKYGNKFHIPPNVCGVKGWKNYKKLLKTVLVFIRDVFVLFVSSAALVTIKM